MRELLIAGLLLLAACGDGSVESTATLAPGDATDSAPDTTSSSLPAASSVTTTVPADTVPEELVDFIDAIEEALRGTTYQGAALEAPDVFLATGALFCEQLDAGADVDDLLTEYVQELSGGSVEEATDDDLVLAGSVLGVGVATLCPQHENLVSG